jgi:hypothetical protein
MLYGVTASEIPPPPAVHPLTRFIAVGTDTDYFASNIQLSATGTTWHYIRTPNIEPDPDTSIGPAPQLLSICTNGARWVATGFDGNYPAVTYAGLVLTSDDDGYHWVSRANPLSASVAQMQGVCWDGTNFIAVGFDGNVTPRVMTSPDGSTWTVRTSNPSTNVTWYSVTATASLAVAVGRFQPGGAAVMTSTDHGVTWSTHNGTPSATYLSVTNNGSLFVAVANGTKIMTSPDGSTWTQRTGAPSTGVDLFGVCWDGTNFIAVGTDTNTYVDAKIMTSTNGTSWTARTAASGSAILRAVVSFNGQAIAAGHNGSYLLPVIQSSPNGTTSWATQTSDPIFTNAGPFFAVGAYPPVDRSPAAGLLSLSRELPFRTLLSPNLAPQAGALALAKGTPGRLISFQPAAGALALARGTPIRAP